MQAQATQTGSSENIDPEEIAKFEAMSMRWWDENGEFKPLHDMNPTRLSYIIKRTGDLKGKKVLDVGCGGGILSESMALAGAEVIGIDMGKANLSIAKMHLHESGAKVNYQQTTVEEISKQHAGEFDLVTCLEMLEHVPDPASIIKACGELIKPDGDIILSTVNRNAKSYAFAILGAEYIMRLLPQGTHSYEKFIRPSELDDMVRKADLQSVHISGVEYNPFKRNCWLSDNVDINYMFHAKKHKLQ